MLEGRVPRCMPGDRERECAALVRPVHARGSVVVGSCTSYRTMVGATCSQRWPCRSSIHHNVRCRDHVEHVHTIAAGPIELGASRYVRLLPGLGESFGVHGIVPVLPLDRVCLLRHDRSTLVCEPETDVLSKRHSDWDGHIGDRSRSEPACRSNLGTPHGGSLPDVLSSQCTVSHRSDDGGCHAVVGCGARGVNDRCTVACRSSIAHRVRAALHTVRSVPRGRCRPWVVCHADRCGRRSVHSRVDRPGNVACSACTSSHDRVVDEAT